MLITAKADIRPPTAAVISAAAVSSSSIAITLVTPSTDAGGVRDYTLESAPTSSGSWSTVASALTAASFPYSNTGLLPSTTVFYRLTTFDTSANSNISAIANATTLANTSSNSPLISWTLSTLNEDNSSLTDLAFVDVYRSATPTFSTATRIARCTGAETSYTDPNPTAGTWYYWVVEIDLEGTPSDPSNMLTRTYP